MRLAVCVKQSLDVSVPLSAANGTVRQDAPRPIVALGAADRAALEAALALRDRVGGAVVALSVGEGEAVGALRYCLARGADRALHVRRPDRLDPVGSGRAAGGALARAADLVLCGRASADGASGLFPAVLAAELDWALVTCVAGVAIDGEGTLKLERRIERGGREVVRCALPAVLAVEPTIAASRYVALRVLRRAERVRIEEVEAEGSPGAGIELIGIEPAKPRPRRGSGPDAKASAMDRLSHLLSGGVKRKRTGDVVEGSPSSVAAEIVSFLEEKGFLADRSGRGNG